MLIGGTLLIALGGIGFAVYMYRKGGFPVWLEETFFYKLLSNQYYIPAFYDKAIMQPFTALSRFAWKQIDQKIVDRTVDMIASGLMRLGGSANTMQTGNLSTMLRWMVVGLVTLLILAIIYRP
jgi:NADH-quinone oxidoreductase subunit L